MGTLARYFLFSGAWLALALLLSKRGCAEGALGWVVTAVLLLAAPVLMAALYTDTVTITHRASVYHRSGLLKRLTTSRILSTLFWTAWAMPFGAATVFWMNSLSHPESGALFASLVLFPVVYAGVLRFTRREMVTYYAHAAALRGARLIFAVSMTLVYLAVLSLFAAPVAEGSLAVRSAAIAADQLDSASSLLVQVASKLFDYLHTFQTFFIGGLARASGLQALALGVCTFALFYNWGFILSGFLIPVAEYRRVFAPVAATDTPGPVSIATVALVAAIVTVFVLFLLLPGVASLEYSLRYRLATGEIVPTMEQKIVRYAEEIDGVMYRAGTIEEIHLAGAQALRDQDALLATVRNQSALAFAQMRENVDRYLDRYYSLPAEYLRIAGALTGQIETLIADELTATLLEGDAIIGLDAAVEQALAKRPQVMQAYQNRVAAILAGGQIADPDGPLVVNRQLPLDPLKAPPHHASLVQIEQRMALSGVSAIGGFIAAKAVAKVSAKGAIKVAAKGFSKVAATKVAAGPAGAAVGAVVGSMVPVAGTLVGSAIGFAVGVVLGISVDALLLELEEFYSREEFRAQILQSIDEQEREFEMMFAASPDFVQPGTGGN
jgi:hypothetical protein